MPTYTQSYPLVMFMMDLRDEQDVDKRIEMLEARLGQLMKFSVEEKGVANDVATCFLYIGSDLLRNREFTDAAKFLNQGLSLMIELPERDSWHNEKISLGFRDLATAHFKVNDFEECLKAAKTGIWVHSHFGKLVMIQRECLASLGRLLLASSKTPLTLMSIQSQLESAALTAISAHQWETEEDEPGSGLRVSCHGLNLLTDYLLSLYSFDILERSIELGPQWLKMLEEWKEETTLLWITTRAVLHFVMAEGEFLQRNVAAAESHCKEGIRYAFDGYTYHPAQALVVVKECFSKLSRLLAISHRYPELETIAREVSLRIHSLEVDDESLYFTIGLILADVVSVLEQNAHPNREQGFSSLALLDEAESHLKFGALFQGIDFESDDTQSEIFGYRIQMSALRVLLLLKSGEVERGKELLAEMTSWLLPLGVGYSGLVPALCEASKTMRMIGDGQSALQYSSQALELAERQGDLNAPHTPYARCLREQFESLIMVGNFESATSYLPAILNHLKNQLQGAQSISAIRLILGRFDDYLDTAQQMYLDLEDHTNAFICREKAVSVFDLLLNQLLMGEDREYFKLQLEIDRLEQEISLWSLLKNNSQNEGVQVSAFDVKLENVHQSLTAALQKIAVMSGSLHLQGIVEMDIDLSIRETNSYYVAIHSLQNCVVFYALNLGTEELHVQKISTLNEIAIKNIFLYKEYSQGLDIDEAHRRAFMPFNSMLSSRQNQGFRFVSSDDYDFESPEWKNLNHDEQQEILKDLAEKSQSLAFKEERKNERLWEQTLIEHMNEVGENVMKPLAEMLLGIGAKDSKIILSGNGWFTRSPLACCEWAQDGQTQCLLDLFDITLSPSLAAYTSLNRNHDNSPAYATCCEYSLDDTNKLAFGAVDVASVRNAFPNAEILKADDVTYERVLDAINRSSVMVFTGHGLQEFVGWNGSIYLKDRQLYLDDVLTKAHMHPGSHVMLMACQTGRTQNGNGVEEFLGFHRGFLQKGASSAWASFWPVDDAATAFLTHRALLHVKAGDPYPVALRKAQLWLRKARGLELLPILKEWRDQELITNVRYMKYVPSYKKDIVPFSHPSYWAGFGHYGA